MIPTVGCVNGITHRLADRLRQETQGTGVDAIVAFPHNYGCSGIGCGLNSYSRNPSRLVLIFFSFTQLPVVITSRACPMGAPYLMTWSPSLKSCKASLCPAGISCRTTIVLPLISNHIYGDTLVEPEILLPDNAACLRLPGTDGKAYKKHPDK